MAVLRQYVPFPYPSSPCHPLTASSDNQRKLTNRFQAVMLKLSLLGHNQDDLTDCSDVIPVPPTFTGQATFPAGFTIDDVEQAVSRITMYMQT